MSATPQRKAVLYARYSPRPRRAPAKDSKGKAIPSALSNDRQFSMLRAHCQQHNLEVVGEFSDEAKSGKSTRDRPGLEAAVLAARKCKGVFIATELSRWARSTMDAVTIEKRLAQGGAKLMSLKESIDTSTPVGRFIYTVLATFAELDRENIAQRTAESHMHAMAQGSNRSGDPPYGWDVDLDGPKNPITGRPRMMKKVASEQETIILIVSKYDDGASLAQIARDLTESNVPTKKGGKWTHIRVKNIIERQAAVDAMATT